MTEPLTDLVEELARVIADALGDNYSDAFKSKDRWIAKRGMSGGRFRDVNEPFRCDYENAARAVFASPILARRDAETWNRAVEAAVGVAKEHRYGDSFLDTCTLRRDHRADIATAIASLKDQNNA